MERIRVDTDELKAKSKVFETSANVYSKAGDEILSFVAGLPSYDGQLSGPARATALEINRQCKELHAGYKEDADTLERIAKAFENVDNQVINSLNSLTSNIGDWLKNFVEGVLAVMVVETVVPLELTAIEIENTFRFCQDIIDGLKNALALSDGKIQAGSYTYGYSYDASTGILIVYHDGKQFTFDLDKIASEDPTLYTDLVMYMISVSARETAEFGIVVSYVALMASALTTIFGIATAPTGLGAVAAIVGGVGFIGSTLAAGSSLLVYIGATNNCQTLWGGIESRAGRDSITPTQNSSP